MLHNRPLWARSPRGAHRERSGAVLLGPATMPDSWVVVLVLTSISIFTTIMGHGTSKCLGHRLSGRGPGCRGQRIDSRIAIAGALGPQFNYSWLESSPSDYNVSLAGSGWLIARSRNVECIRAADGECSYLHQLVGRRP